MSPILIGSAFFGLIIGSFLSMLIPRLHFEEKGIVFGRSHCSHCKHTLGASELIPVLSYVIQGGSCKHCKKRIDAWYPVIELTSALSFAGIALLFPNLELWIWHAVILTVLLFIFFYDLRFKEIHDAVMIPAILMSIAYAYFLGNFTSAWIAAALATAFFGLQWLASRGRWIGIGDLRIGLFMAFILGWPQWLVAILISYISGSLIGVGLIASGKAGRQTALPLGPFLVLGTVIAVLYGDALIAWYLSI